MLRMFNRSLISIALLIGGGITVAEEESTEIIQSQLNEQESTLKTQAGENVSAVTEASQNLISANVLITQTGNTVMTAGTCLVIDDIVRQFCGANPNDVSCQFQ
jgi:hypothetical protein